MTALSWAGKQFRISPLLYQAHWIAIVAIADVSIIGFHLDAAWHSIPQRLITFGLVAGLLYVSSNLVRQPALPWNEEIFVILYRWAASGLLALLIWMQFSLSVPRREWLIAVLWTALALALSAAGQLLKRSEFKWQAFTLAMMSFLSALYLNFDATQEFHGITYRLLSVTLVAGGTYLLARWTPIARVKPLYSWAGTILFGYLAYRETEAQHQLWTPVLWIALATLLGLAGRFWKDRALLWQTHLLAAAATLWTLVITFQSYHDTPAHLTTMLIAVPITAALLYAFTWVTAVPQFAETSSIKPAYTWAGTVLFGYLAYTQTADHHELWTPVLWIGMAAILALAARFWKNRHLLWQTYLLAVAATAWTIYVSFLANPANHGTRTQLITVLITSALLYGLTWMVNLAGLIESDRIWQAYSWAGSLLLTWLGWYQLQPINLSLAWGVFALVIFEIGSGSKSSYLRLQAYIAAASSFAHLFYSNFNTLLPAGTLDPHILLIVLLVPIYIWIYWRLHEKGEAASPTESRLKIEYLLPYLGTATVAALARFEIYPESVVIGYAAVVLATLVVAWQLRLQVFLHQALIMLGVTAFRLSLHNFRNLNISFISTLPSCIWAIALLALALPIAFQLRTKKSEDSGARRWVQFLLRRPEQALFFVCVGLAAALLYIRMHGMVLTFALSVEGVAVILGGFFVKEKSFVWTGLVLVLFCAGKIFVDLKAAAAGVRYLAMAGVGALLVFAGYLFAKNRDALREYL